MKTTMTADQAKKLAALVATVRPGWALNAITNALWDVRTRPLHKVAAAALRAATAEFANRERRFGMTAAQVAALTAAGATP